VNLLQKIGHSFGKSASEGAMEKVKTVVNEVKKGKTDILPVVLTGLGIGLTVLVFGKSSRPKTTVQHITIINNYIFGGK
jgi:hypothetical protein